MNRSNVLVAEVAGLVAGAMAMAAGEYVSVHSQADTEHAELKRESAELKSDKGEHEELMAIYVDRGLDPSLAKQVAEQLMAHDRSSGAHARDELGISRRSMRADPSCVGFGQQLRRWSGRASLVTAIAPTSSLIIVVPLTSLVFLALLGAYAGAGGANVTVGAIRIILGALAMAVTASVGAVFGTIV